MQANTCIMSVAFACLCVYVCSHGTHANFTCLITKKAPADALALLRWTLEAVDGYFTALGKRQLWLPKQQAIACVQYSQRFTEPWLHYVALMPGLRFIQPLFMHELMLLRKDTVL